MWLIQKTGYERHTLAMVEIIASVHLPAPPQKPFAVLLNFPFNLTSPTNPSNLRFSHQTACNVANFSGIFDTAGERKHDLNN